MLIGYARVSTARRDQSLDSQRNTLVDAGCDPKHIYYDTITGTKWQRPGFDTALEHAGTNDKLIVTQLDRLGRNLSEVVTTISDLADRGIALKVLDPPFDTSLRADKVVAHVMASLARWEREFLAQRTREGVAHARSQGRIAGPKPKLSSEQKRQAVKLVASGESVTIVARSFHVSRQTIYRALREMEREKPKP